MQSKNICWIKHPAVYVDGSLKPNVFSRFYCEVLFHHFDANCNGMLELKEISRALAYLRKPGAEAPVVAFPSQFAEGSGETRLDLKAFWALFASMD